MFMIPENPGTKNIKTVKHSLLPQVHSHSMAKSDVVRDEERGTSYSDVSPSLMEVH